MLDKELLLNDLCARLPYGVMATSCVKVGEFIVQGKISSIYPFGEGTVNIGMVIVPIEKIKPYLRPMSSMTEDECIELSKIRPFDDDVEAWKYIKTPVPLKIANTKHFDFFNRHHLDWRGLIPKGLALEAPDGMYNLNEK